MCFSDTNVNEISSNVVNDNTQPSIKLPVKYKFSFKIWNTHWHTFMIYLWVRLVNVSSSFKFLSFKTVDKHLYAYLC